MVQFRLIQLNICQWGRSPPRTPDLRGDVPARAGESWLKEVVTGEGPSVLNRGTAWEWSAPNVQNQKCNLDQKGGINQLSMANTT